MSIQMKNGCLVYYGNLIGYQAKNQTEVTVDPQFRREELESWLARRGLVPRWEEGVYGTITGCGGYHIVPFTGQYFPRTESAALWWHYGYCRPKTFTKNQSEENCSGSQGR